MFHKTPTVLIGHNFRCNNIQTRFEKLLRNRHKMFTPYKRNIDGHLNQGWVYPINFDAWCTWNIRRKTYHSITKKVFFLVQYWTYNVNWRVQKGCKGQSEVLNLCQSPASLITYLLLTLHHFSWTANWFSPIVLKIWLSYVLEISIKLCHLITPEWEKKNIKLRFQPHKKPENLWLKMKKTHENQAL